MGGPEDELARNRLGRAIEIAGNRQHVSNVVPLGVGHRRVRQRIAVLAKGKVFVNDTANQITVRVIVADGVLVEGALIEDIKGTRTASAHDRATFISSVDQIIGDSAVALADRVVSGSLAG